MYGAFDLNKTPIAPLGTKVIVHEKPANRGTWAPHGVDGWYIGPAMEHCRCFRVWITDSRHERVADTLAWFPKHVPMPTTSSADAITISLQEIAQHLRDPKPAGPLAPVADKHRQALNQLAELFDAARNANLQQTLLMSTCAYPSETFPKKSSASTTYGLVGIFGRHGQGKSQHIL